MIARHLLVALVVGYLAFRTGQWWDEPHKLAAFWGVHGLLVVAGLLGWALWRGLCTLYGRVVLRFEKGRALERAYTVAYLRHQADEHRRMVRDPRSDVLRHDLEVGEIVLEQAADDIEAQLHVPARWKP